MEPRPFSHGYLGGFHWPYRRRLPSMEPRPFSHGYFLVSPGSLSQMYLQWSHDLSAMDTTQPQARCRITSILQWSHDLSAMDTSSSSMVWRSHSMNLQWSHDLSAMDTGKSGQWLLLTLLPPSMEPRPFSHGYSEHIDADTQTDVLPSMEPRPFSHGYLQNV